MNDGVIHVCVVIALPPIYCLFTSGLEQDLSTNSSCDFVARQDSEDTRMY